MLACLPHQQHELGLLIFGVALRRRGWQITYLGTNTPIDAVADTTRSLRPAVVVLSSINPDNFSDHPNQIAQLATQTQVLLAGTGATPHIAHHTHTHLLDHDPATAATTLDQGHPTRTEARTKGASP